MRHVCETPYKVAEGAEVVSARLFSHKSVRFFEGYLLKIFCLWNYYFFAYGAKLY